MKIRLNLMEKHMNVIFGNISKSAPSRRYIEVPPGHSLVRPGIIIPDSVKQEIDAAFVAKMNQQQLHAKELAPPPNTAALALAAQNQGKEPDPPEIKRNELNERVVRFPETDVPPLRVKVTRISRWSAQLVKGHVLYRAWKRTHQVSGEGKQKNLAAISALENLAKGGLAREFARPANDWELQLASLEQRHPNFKDVVRYIRGETALASAADMPPRFTPILLVGPPGIGKTVFAMALAKILGTTIHKFNFETAQTGSPLDGSEEFWSNSKPGRLLASLTEGQWVNPLFLLDEVDKANSRPPYSPLNSLYSLLEEKSAQVWADVSLPTLTLDASRVTWLLTANQIDMIPLPLQSRTLVFNIPALTSTQTADVVQSVYAEIVREYPRLNFALTLDDDVVQALSRFSPREMRSAARALLANTVLAKRGTPLVEDVPKSSNVTAPSIGFV
jgi:DNA polymerase III delta prime subunit